MIPSFCLGTAAKWLDYFRFFTRFEFFKYYLVNSSSVLPEVTCLGTMTSSDFSRQALLRCPIGATFVRPPRVRTRSFPSCSCLIYTDGSVQLLDFVLCGRLIHHQMPDEVLVHQLKGLPPASFSLRLTAHTLLLAMRLPLPAPLGTFTR